MEDSRQPVSVPLTTTITPVPWTSPKKIPKLKSNLQLMKEMALKSALPPRDLRQIKEKVIVLTEEIHAPPSYVTLFDKFYQKSDEKGKSNSTCGGTQLSQLKLQLRAQMNEKRNEYYNKKLTFYRLNDEEILRTDKAQNPEMEDDEEQLLETCDNDASEEVENSVQTEDTDKKEEIEDTGEKEETSDSDDESIEEVYFRRRKKFKRNDFIDDEAEDDGPEEEEDEYESDSDGDVDLDSVAVKPINVAQDGNISSTSEQGTDSFANTSTVDNSTREKAMEELEEIFEDSFPKPLTQQIVFSPCHEKNTVLKRDRNTIFDEYPMDEEFAEEQADISQLLDLCSGRFATTQPKTSVDDSSSDKEEFSNFRKRMRRKIFAVDEDDDENETIKIGNYDLLKAEANDTASSKKSDEENADDDSGEDSEVENEEEGEEEVELPKVSEKIRREFFDEEAELSGSEASSDEEDDENDEELQDMLVNDAQDLPSEDELRNQVERFFQKQALDEDKRRLLEIQEKFHLEDGDLLDGKNRQRKFRWKNVNNDHWVENSDSDDSEPEDISAVGVLSRPKLKQLTLEMTQKITESLKSPVKRPQAQRCFGGPANSITSYIVRDEKLKNVISIKRPKNNANTVPTRKRMKQSTTKDSRKSVFDLLSRF